MENLVIAIDGPAGAGKSTVAQILAQRLQYNYIDTGAMYRAAAWKVIQSGIDIKSVSAVIDVINSTDISLKYYDGKTSVFVDGNNVTADIRTPEISNLVPKVAQIREVRDAMLYLQRQMADAGKVVMDGRDIGTHVLPNANIKIFLTASIDERANRRWRELINKGFSVDLKELKKQIAERDKTDSERDVAPLTQAVDAVLIDTTGLTIEQAVSKILDLVRRESTLV